MKQLKFLLATVLCSFPLFSSDIYDSIKTLPFDPAGHFATGNALDEIFKKREINTVIELGSWAGASTRFFGYRVSDDGKVYAIDHWNGSHNHRGELTDSRLSYIYHLFLSNIRHAGLEERIIPIRMSSTEAARALDITADLIYIDGSRNTDEVYEYIMSWYPHLNQNGIMCGAEWREPGVQKGVHRAAEELGFTVRTDRKKYFWVFE